RPGHSATDSCQKPHPDWHPRVRRRRSWDPETIGRRHGRDTGPGSGKAGGDPHRVSLRQARLDPVGDAAVPPDQRVGREPEYLWLTVTGAAANDDRMRLSGDPPAGIAIHRGLLHGGPGSHLLSDEVRDEVATELRDEHAQPGLFDQRNAGTRRVRERHLTAGR